MKMSFIIFKYTLLIHYKKYTDLGKTLYLDMIVDTCGRIDLGSRIFVVHWNWTMLGANSNVWSKINSSRNVIRTQPPKTMAR